MRNFKLLLVLVAIVAMSCSKENVAPDTPNLEIGEAYGGGVVIQLPENGTYGLIISDYLVDSEGNDQFIWGSYKILTDANHPGDGLDNTNKIMSVETSPIFAAKMCVDYRGGGFDDWYLPSPDELESLRGKTAYIWSSREVPGNSAEAIRFPDGGPNTNIFYDKDNKYKVRAMRRF